MNALVDIINGWGSRFVDFAQPVLVQSSLLIGLLLVLEAGLRDRVRAALRHGLWLLVLVKLVLPPSLALPTSVAYWLPAKPGTAPALALALALPATPADPTPLEPTANAVAAPSRAHLSPPQAALTWAGGGLLIWLAGVATLTIGVLWRCRNVHRLLAGSTPAPTPAAKLLDACRQQLGLRRRVALRCVEALDSPAICGLLRPVILLPAALPSRLGEAELRSVLLHELAHLKRGDLWVRHGQTALQVFYWYNPLLWLANTIIRRLREQAVDDLVLVELREDAEVYPSTLLQVARLTLERPVFGLGLLGILESRSALARRIRRIVDCPLPQRARLGLPGLAWVGLIALVALPMAGPRQSAVAQTLNPATGLPGTNRVPIDPTTGLPVPRSSAIVTQAARGPAGIAAAAATIESNRALTQTELRGSGPLPPASAEALRAPGWTNRYGLSGRPVGITPPPPWFPPGFVPPNPFVAGTTLLPEQAEELEAKLAKNPEDLVNREALIGYYHRLRSFSAQAATARIRHALWIIEHHPEAYNASYEQMLRHMDGTGFEEAAALWLAHVKANPTNAAFLLHAAGYAPLPDGRTAETLLAQALKLDPQNPTCQKNLAAVYVAQAQPGDTDEKRALAQKALALFEQAQANTPQPQLQFYNLRDLAQTALLAGDLKKARTYACDLLEQSIEADNNHWGGADASFKSHLILGQVALREGNITEARKQLLESADLSSDTPSPVLSSFGPNMTLAKALLEKGEKEAVLEFLKRCREFWSSGKDKLDAWSWQVTQGETPDFGANLLY